MKITPLCVTLITTTWFNSHRLPLNNSDALPPVHELFKRPPCMCVCVYTHTHYMNTEYWRKRSFYPDLNVKRFETPDEITVEWRKLHNETCNSNAFHIWTQKYLEESLKFLQRWRSTSPWKWRQHGPPKCWYPTITLHGITTRKTLKYSYPYFNIS